jgi:hypothetical protein
VAVRGGAFAPSCSLLAGAPPANPLPLPLLPLEGAWPSPRSFAIAVLGSVANGFNFLASFSAALRLSNC